MLPVRNGLQEIHEHEASGYIDIFDWNEGVNNKGIDLSRPVYKRILQVIKIPNKD